MKAIVTGRCSDVPPPSSTCARIAGDRHRASVSNGIVGRGCSGILAAWPARLALEQHAGTLRVPETAGGEQRGGFGAEQNLARLRRVLHRNEAAPAGPGGQQLDVRRADRKEMEFARMHALRHPQRDLRPRNLDAADRAQHPAHQRRRTARALDVAVTLEPEQQRVAPELEQAATVARTPPRGSIRSCPRSPP